MPLLRLIRGTSMARASILLITKDRELTTGLRHLAGEMGAELGVADSLHGAAKAMARQSFDVLFVQVDSPGDNIRERIADGLIFAGRPPVIAISNEGSIQDVVSAIRAGAHDYLCPPPSDAGTLGEVLRHVLHPAAATAPETPAKRRGAVPFEGFLTADRRMLSICQTVAGVADSSVAVLIEGESGTGKSLLAMKLHENSVRRLAPFVRVNCGALSERLVEGELFGPTKGVSPSAHGDHRCSFELADGGTLLLDAASNLSPRLLGKVLHAAGSGRFRRAEQPATLRSNVRLVVTSDTPLEPRPTEGLLEESLCSAVRVSLPPLWERIADITLLADHFLRLFSARHRRTVRGISPGAMSQLVRYRWPGNVRELRNAVEYSVILTRSEVIGLGNLPQCIARTPAAAQGGDQHFDSLPLKAALRQPERLFILHALRSSGWKKRDAAKRLQISRSTLYKKMKEHGIERESDLIGSTSAHRQERRIRPNLTLGSNGVYSPKLIEADGHPGVPGT